MKNLAWGALIFNLLVIVWGAFVRASGSGAGCGSHWPLCNGQIIPHTGLIETSIEFAHRITSGICLLLAVAIAWVGVRDYPKGHLVRKGALSVLGFTLMEAIIGAGLVLFGYVAHDKSIGRVVSISMHLTNTFLLLASLTLTAWWSSCANSYAFQTKEVRPRKLWRVAITALALTILVGMSGAITALGDTLFQATSLSQGFHQDFMAASHFLTKLRVFHPLLAVSAAALLFYFAELAADARLDHPYVGRLTTALKTIVAVQVGLGLLNLVLLAPTPLQLLHLLVAESVWILLVLVTAVTFEVPHKGLSC